ncbi:MAG: VOC family protein [Chloroflexota bacterium]|nr:VOC family protein [Chloroflexota bacterium]
MAINVTWVEFPVIDIERAAKFYQHVFKMDEGSRYDDEQRRTLILSGDGMPGFSLNQTANFEPSDKGAYVYLSCGDDLGGHMARVTEAGGTVMTEKTSMDDTVSYCTVKDTEGNVFGLSGS